MADSYEFYDVKTRSKINLEKDKIHKTKFVSESGRTTYALRGTTSDGRSVTKFVSKNDWEALDVSEK
jgi:hypothetical protein